MHIFDPTVAESVGVNAAVIFQNLVFWCEKNEANGRHEHDGKFWSYNSITAFEKLFPYLTKSQIRTALLRLEEAEFIEVSSFNKDPRDRTKWYCIKSHLHLRLNTSPFATDRKPLPDSKPDIKQDTCPDGQSLFGEIEDQIEPSKEDQLSKEIDAGFEEFWNTIWPKHPRKTQPKLAKEKYRECCEGKNKKTDTCPTPKELNDAAWVYVNLDNSKKENRQFMSGPVPWLNGAKWEPFLRRSSGANGGPHVNPFLRRLGEA